MAIDLQTLLDRFVSWIELLRSVVTDSGNLLQLALIAAAFAASLLVSRVARAWLELRVKRLQHRLELMRILAGLVYRQKWFYFLILTTLLWLLLGAAGWSVRLIYLALLFTLAWLLITVISQSIANRLLRRFFAFTGWLYVAISILGINDKVESVLDSARLTLSATTTISLLMVIKVVLILVATLWLAVTVGAYLERRVLRNKDMAPGLRVLAGKILRITLVVIAVLIAISSLGIDLTVFSVFSGAIGVGIGFGLQKVVSNFISGLIILADRSIKPGDTISLGETFGWINELRARFVSVVTRDGREYLIPNEDFITQQVINWSFSNELIRLDVNFGVSYDSDPREVAALAIAAAEHLDRVISYRPPVCWMTGFGESSLDFVLRFWIKDPQNGMTNVRGMVLLALWDTFKKHDIRIPYPHREVIIKAPETKAQPDSPP